MSDWKLKRFWTDVAVRKAAGGHEVTLDDRPVRTPAKAGLILPTAELAEAVAAEWRAQDGQVDPATMPFTRSANAAIDRVAPQKDAVADLIAAYGDSDLLCYRADTPEALVHRQCAHWDPALDWAAERLGARLYPRAGVIHKPQPGDALARLADRVRACGPFHLTALHDLVGLTGSLVLGFAAAEDWRPADAVWALSRIDEDWQAEQWGVDEEAARDADMKRRDFLHAKRFFDLAGPGHAA